ncbi:restriction endonuclease subunit S [Geobacter sulfurreducens]|uniref:restriction endonuclease subunit S n=1 Tax=Geobacter sulfurreducens TaxID=35554 RepID=UPI002D1FB9CD|nr:restriction endonuclease subunit S [Geobacter sulfurreducens]
MVVCMRKRLGDISLIQIGYSFRGRLEAETSGAVAVIQMKDLVADVVEPGGLVRIDMERPREHHLARVGDLVFRSRGVTNTCAILLDDPGEAVVSAPLFRIRVTDRQLLPQYLNWYINQPPAQAFLASHAKGTAQQMISKDALENLEVFIPPLERQKAIIGVAALADQEQNLMKTLAEKRKQYLSAKLIEIAQGEGRR